MLTSERPPGTHQPQARRLVSDAETTGDLLATAALELGQLEHDPVARIERRHHRACLRLDPPPRLLVASDRGRRFGLGQRFVFEPGDQPLIADRAAAVATADQVAGAQQSAARLRLGEYPQLVEAP